MQIAKSITKQIIELGASVYPIKDVNVLESNEKNTIFQLNIGKRNIEEGKEYTYQNLYKLNKNGLKLLDEGKQHIATTLVQKSAINDGKYSAKLQQIPDPNNKLKNNTVLEIYTLKPQFQLLQSLNLQKFHDDVLSSDIFGQALQWNSNQNKLVYLAKPKNPDQTNFLQCSFDKEIDYESASAYRKYRQDWGEQMNDVYDTNLYMYDVDKKELNEVQVPKDSLLTHIQFDSQDGIIVCATKFSEFKHGIAHCFNRESCVYRIQNPVLKRIHPPLPIEDVVCENKLSELTLISNDDVCRHPITNLTKDKLIYFGTPLRHQHCCNLSIKMIDIMSQQCEEIVPIIDQNLTIEVRQDFNKRNKLFNGKCGYYDDLSTVFWLKDNRHFVFNSISSGQKGIFIVDTLTKEVCKISHLDNTNFETQQILKYDSQSNLLFITIDNVLRPGNLGIVQLDQIMNRQGPLSDSILKLKPNQFNVQGDIYQKDQQILQEDLVFSGNAEGFLWRIKNEKLDDSKRPLIVLIHGGPHGASFNQFSILRYFLLQQGKMLKIKFKGFAILVPNFTGSAGYGQKFFEELSGKIGQLDAAEIIHMIEQVTQQGKCDAKKVIAVGGSYGGFMGGILGTRYPDYFQGAVISNPAINIPFMMHISDIPDWCFSVTLQSHKTWNVSPEDYKKMYEMSPVSQPMRIPTLLFLGQKDRRCPYQQSLAFQAQCLFNKTEIETFVYPESDHSLSDSLHTQFDVIIKSLLFINKKVGSKVEEQI